MNLTTPDAPSRTTPTATEMMGRQATPRDEAHEHISDAARIGYFLRHLGEMSLAMMVGMGMGAVALVLIFSTVLASNVRGLTSDEAISRYPELVCLAVAAGMVATMTGWMRYRGMFGRPLAEMTVAMVVPLVPISGLL